MSPAPVMSLLTAPPPSRLEGTTVQNRTRKATPGEVAAHVRIAELKDLIAAAEAEMKDLTDPIREKMVANGWTALTVGDVNLFTFSWVTTQRLDVAAAEAAVGSLDAYRVPSTAGRFVPNHRVRVATDGTVLTA
jgi:hypothetical protein